MEQEYLVTTEQKLQWLKKAKRSLRKGELLKCPDGCNRPVSGIKRVTHKRQMSQGWYEYIIWHKDSKPGDIQCSFSLNTDVKPAPVI